MKNLNITKCPTMAEVELNYKTKVKAGDRVKITTPKECYTELKKIWDLGKIEHIEEFVVLMLNRANEVLGWAKISSGGTAAVVCDPKVIFQLALLHHASGIILSHNHPSGATKPSNEDITVTKKIIEAGKTLDILVLDHIILTQDSFYSFNEEGLI